MVVEDQEAVIAWLASPAAHGGAPVEQIATHSAIVFLAGDRAWKLKRAVLYDYLDFSTVERRRVMCDAEVRLNRRTAPDLYVGVVPITRAPDGTLALNGAGVPLDWVVEMRRFDQGDLCDRRAAAGTLDLATVDRLASAIAAFHRDAARRHDFGGREAMLWVVDGNAVGLSQFGGEWFDTAALQRMTKRAREAVHRHALTLNSRRDAGCVRQCHGDLHLRNIVLLDGEPRLFDAIEFNDDLSCIDTWYDLAFLLMDLWKRGLRTHANVVMNRYLGETSDMGGLPLLPLFLSCRAAIRAKTSATAATLQQPDPRRAELEALSRQYLAMSEELLQPSAPTLVAVGGLSGTGKSTLARHIAASVGAVPGAVILRSDEIRKELSGVPRLVQLGPDGYAAEMSLRVYTTLAERAGRLLKMGRSVISDAVYARQADRQLIENVAETAGVRFVGFWLDAPEAVLVERITSRRLGGDDPSDADSNVVRSQLAQPLETVGWQHLDAARAVEHVVHDALLALG
jgi:aminoglycoside phosphotransferase family enzyme/predicted kinase